MVRTIILSLLADRRCSGFAYSESARSNMISFTLKNAGGPMPLGIIKCYGVLLNYAIL